MPNGAAGFGIFRPHAPGRGLVRGADERLDAGLLDGPA